VELPEMHALASTASELLKAKLENYQERKACRPHRRAPRHVHDIERQGERGVVGFHQIV